MTLNQLMRQRSTRLKQPKWNRLTALNRCPFKRAICQRVYTTTPRKPSSAIRKVARVLIAGSGGLVVTTYIPGQGHNLQKHSNVIIRGGRVKDLPGVLYKAVRGRLDFPALTKIRNGRSFQGLSRQAAGLTNLPVRPFRTKRLWPKIR